MNDVSKYVGKINAEYRQQHFKNIIAVDPQQIQYMGADYIVRFSQPTNSKIIHYAGYKNKDLVAECYIILNDDAEKPDKIHPVVNADTGAKYQIIDFQQDFGKNCYIFNLESKK